MAKKGIEITTTHLRELTGFSYVAVTKVLKAAGVAGEKRGNSVFYNSVETLGAIYKSIITGAYSPGVVGPKKKTDNESPGEETTLADEKRLLAIEQRRKLKIENDSKQKVLINADVLSDILYSVSNQVAALLDEIPSKIKRVNPGITARDLEIIKKEIAKTRNICSSVEFKNE